MAKLFENNMEKEPVITFILGNGFDLSLHMETSYSHIYSTYVDTPSSTNVMEAIKVEMPGIGHIGYVANSPYTVVGESYSAGRLYDKIGDTAKGTVLYVLPKGVLCVLNTDEKPHKKK